MVTLTGGEGSRTRGRAFPSSSTNPPWEKMILVPLVGSRGEVQVAVCSWYCLSSSLTGPSSQHLRALGTSPFGTSSFGNTLETSGISISGNLGPSTWGTTKTGPSVFGSSGHTTLAMPHTGTSIFGSLGPFGSIAGTRGPSNLGSFLSNTMLDVPDGKTSGYVDTNIHINPDKISAYQH